MDTRHGHWSVHGLWLVPVIWPAVAIAQEAPPQRAHPAPPFSVLAGEVVDQRGTAVSGCLVAAASVDGARIWRMDEQIMQAFGKAEFEYLLEARPSVKLTGELDEEGKAIFKWKTNGREAGVSRTFDDGRFRIADLKPGQFHVLAIHKEHGIALVAAEQPNSDNPIRIVLEPRFVEGEVRGVRDSSAKYSVSVDSAVRYPWQVSRADVTKMSGAQVPASELEALRTYPLTTDVDADGRFKIGPILHGGSWNLGITQSLPKRRAYLTLAAEHVEANEEGTTSVVIDLSGGEFVRGTARGPADEPLDDVCVTLTRVAELGEPEPALFARGALSDADGRYSVAGLRPGKYKLEAERWLAVGAGCGSGTLELAATKEIRVPPVSPADGDVRAERYLVLRPGEAAPDFRAVTIDGKEIALSGLRGRVVLIDFWATWCVPCIAELPTIATALEQHGGDGEFVVVGISLDADADVVRRFVAEKSVSWPQIVLGPTGQNEIAKLYNVTGLPATYLIDRDGKIAASYVRGVALHRELGKLFQPEAD